MYIPFTHKCLSCSSSAVRMRDFMLHVIMLERSCVVCSSSVYFVQNGWVGLKTPSHFLLQLQNRASKPFFVKGIWLSLHVRFVNNGSVLPPTSRVTFPMWLSRASARWAFVVKKYIHYFFFFWKWPIVLLDKTLIPRLGSCRALWSCFETAIWTFNPLAAIEVHFMEKNPGMFSSKTLISFQMKKERHEHLGWHGGE